MPPKRRRSSTNTAITAPIPSLSQPSPSRIPRRKSVTASTSATAARRPSIPSANERVTPRTSLVEDDIPKPTPHGIVPAPPPPKRLTGSYEIFQKQLQMNRKRDNPPLEEAPFHKPPHVKHQVVQQWVPEPPEH